MTTTVLYAYIIILIPQELSGRYRLGKMTSYRPCVIIMQLFSIYCCTSIVSNYVSLSKHICTIR